MTKLITLRKRVSFVPSSLISKGRVTIPTMVRVVMKAEPEYEAPPLLPKSPRFRPTQLVCP